MKQSLLISTLLLFCSNTSTLPLDVSKTPLTNSNLASTIYHINNLKKMQLCRIILLPALLTCVACVQSANMKDLIKSYPISFVALAYLTGNYLIDSWGQYKKTKEALYVLNISQALTHYMLCLVAIKKHYTSQTHNLSAQECQEYMNQQIINVTGYNFEELECFTTELIQYCIILTQCYISYQSSADFHYNSYYTLKPNISMEQLIISAQCDHPLCTVLHNYRKDPINTFEDTIQTVCKLIKKEVQFFVKKNIHILP